jgi:hypothetical protein
MYDNRYYSYMRNADTIRITTHVICPTIEQHTCSLNAIRIIGSRLSVIYTTSVLNTPFYTIILQEQLHMKYTSQQTQYVFINHYKNR